MFIFGHLGIGAQLARPWTRGLRLRWVLLGTLLPDLIDKPIYYALSLATGKRGAELGLISCTRTFAHTAIFAVALALIAIYARSRAMAALVLGIATHLLLDNLSDAIREAESRTAFKALIWPFSRAFGDLGDKSVTDHLMGALNHDFVIAAEVIGALLLYRIYLKRKGERKSLSRK